MEWCRRHHSTRLHPDGEYDVWRVEIDLAADEPFHPVHVVRQGDALAYGRSRSAAGRELTAMVRMDPFSWPESDEVRLGCGYVVAAVTSEALKRDPRPFAQVLDPGAVLVTGAVWTLASFPDFDVSVDLGLVAEGDTELTHGRWRLREVAAATLPEPYAFLRTGRLSGRSPNY